ncbi:sterol desaturase family protein [Spirulina subsalsa FACHB-351]|uniref:Sterol desaturase family protein n=1 Tax=Spirulina subsalsa FACHB-351 TaxID=234711 RepID=A0ABT3L0N1_9CYAN|nr:sterol desaturase family protein [Spirulina subsalsa]MCW6035042.1 sterol desaturase family protein [Spirulina subsalsa FACHB-351]
MEVFRLFISVYFISFALTNLAYFITAILGFVTVQLWLKKHRKRISKKTFLNQQIKQEMLQSFQSNSIFSLFWTITWLKVTPHNQLYFDFAEWGWQYWVLSFIVLLILHDTYVYWVHRLMHHPKLYRYLHQKHHISVDASPFSGYSLNQSEAIIHALFFGVVSHIFPIHCLVIVLIMGFSILANVIGHLGYEAMPKNWLKFGGLLFNTTTHHDIHHLYGGRYNYGVYFRFWDWIMDTESPNYQQTFDQATRSID